MAGKSYLIPPAERLGLSWLEAAEMVGVSPTTFDAMVIQGAMPRPKRWRGRLLWERRMLERAFAELPEDGAPAEPNPYHAVAA